MTITKPFTFAAGTKARANEVNTDFDVLYAQVNTNISDIASLSNEISGFDLTKADVNGSALNTFAVKDPVNSSDAVNKGYMESHTITAEYLGNNAVMITGNQTVGGIKTFSAAPIITTTGFNSANGRILAIADRKTGGNFAIKLSDSTIIQGGTSVSAATSNPWVNFPINFSSTNYFAMAYGIGASNWGNAWGFKNGMTNTGCRFYVDAGDTFTWIAIGR